jgi:hypothetical protein
MTGGKVHLSSFFSLGRRLDEYKELHSRLHRHLSVIGFIPCLIAIFQSSLNKQPAVRILASKRNGAIYKNKKSPGDAPSGI